MYLRKIILFALVLAMFPWAVKSQEAVSLSPEEIKEYETQSRQLIDYLESTLNFLGDQNQAPSEKDIIINQSYAKIFQSDETQIEDDLDPNRDITLNKNVQAYLKDVDFFFKNVNFTFDITAVDQLVADNGQMVFKITLNRHLQGVSINFDSINNNQIRYVEINLNPVQKELKIASIYTSKPNQNEEMRWWWKQMSQSWKDHFGDTLLVYDTLAFAKIYDFTDSALVLQRWAEDIRVDTMLAYGGDTLFMSRAADSIRYLGDTVLFSTMHYLRVYDTIPVDVSVIYRNIKQFLSQNRIDISWNMSISNLNPLTELADLKEVYFSNTLIDEVSPLRNLNDLEKIVCSGSKVKSLDPLRYASNLKEINCQGTQINDVGVLSNLKKLIKLSIGETGVTSIDTLWGLTSISQLDLAGLQLDEFSALSSLTNLSDLNLAETNITSLEALSGLKSLRNLNIGKTEVTDVSPLKTVTGLTILQANNSRMNDIEPLSGMEELQVIYCDNTGINSTQAQNFMAANPHCLVIYNTGELKQWWYDLPSVYKSITKQKLEISEPITTEQLHTIINQTQVDLSGHPEISDVEPLKMLHRIEKLNLANTNVGDLGPLSGLNNLSELNISHTRVKTLEPLNDLQNIKTVNCEFTMVDDLLYLANNTNLQAVYCDRTEVDQANVLKLVEILPTTLVIYQSKQLHEWWAGLNQNWQSIFKRQMKQDEEVSDESLQRLVDKAEVEIYDNPDVQNLEPLSHFKRLKVLTVSNTRINSIAPLQNLPKLTVLNVPNNPIAEMPEIMQFKSLEVLNIENTPIEDLKEIGKVSWIKTLNIAGTEVKKLKGIEGMTALEKLFINNTPVKKIDELEELPNLKQLTCYRTDISSKTIEQFRVEFPEVEVDYY